MKSRLIEKTPALERWLSRVSESTRERYHQRFTRFMAWLREDGGQFADYTPDELLAYQKEADNGSIFDILDVVQRYISSLELRYKTKLTYYAVIKSFFMHNRVTLPKDGTFHIRSDEPPVIGVLTVKEIRDAVLSSNQTYKAVLLSMFQAGLDRSSFEYWNEHGWESLREQLRGDPDLVKIDLPGRKHQRNKRSYYTFIGRDAIEAIRRYIPNRPVNPERPGFIFYSKDRAPLKESTVAKYWYRLLGRMDLLTPQGQGNQVRYGRNLHEFRDVRRSQWEKAPSQASVCEFTMGHVVDALGYNKAHRDMNWVRQEYRRALPLLEIMSSDTPFGVVDLQEVEQLRAQVRELESGGRERRIDELERQVEKLTDLLEHIYKTREL